ncbi:PE-PGRS family protein [Streptomyces sp. NPDC052496]|uniref:WXG100-like domain-containing protein n=1 Tax=Streptomyces sp. NPDC052496 TaxID=3154951 RepID=UPI00341CCE5A
MSLTLPSEVAWVLGLLGYDWPQADEDALFKCAETWRNFAAQVEQAASQGTSAANEVVAANTGEAVDGFTKEWGAFSGSAGSDHYLRDAQIAAETIALAFDAAAIAVLSGKIAIIAQLVALAVELIAAQAAAPFTFGLSEAGAVGATQITRVAVREILNKIKQEVVQAVTKAMEHATMDAIKKLAKKAVSKEARQLAMDYAKKTVKDTVKETVQDKVVEEGKAKATEAATEMGQNVAQQGIENHFGARDGMDWGETADIGKEKAGEYVDGLKEGAQSLADPQTYVDHAKQDLTNRGLDAAQKHVDSRTGGAATRHQGVTDGARDSVQAVFG